MKNNLGAGVMINMLFGYGNTIKVIKKAIGKKILRIYFNEDSLHFEFKDGYKMRIFDDGQSCCESRYMRTDDRLEDFKNTIFKGAEVRDAPNEPDEYGEHEVQFLIVHTGKGDFTIASHNEHNGYYGGFSIKAETE